MRSVWKYKAEARAEQHQSSDGGSSTPLHAVLAAAHAGKLGVCFSGAAFGAAYQLGAAQILQELGLLGPDTPVAGASAGAIVAVGTRCRLGQLDVLGALTATAEDLLQHGEKGRLQGVLQQQMQQILPPDAYQLCSSNVTHSQAHYHITQPQDQASDQAGGAGTSSSSVRRPPCVLGATRVRPCCPACLEPDVFIGGYSSNGDLLDALLTGAHIPGTSGGSLLAHYRGHLYIDSGLRDPCPAIPGVQHTLIVYPVPANLFRRPWPYRLLMKPPLQDAITISPGLYGRPWPYSRSYKDSNDLVMHPQPAGVLHMLFERGRRDALAWAQHIGLTAEHVQHLRSLSSASAPPPAGTPAAQAPAAKPAAVQVPVQAPAPVPAPALACTSGPVHALAPGFAPARKSVGSSGGGAGAADMQHPRCLKSTSAATAAPAPAGEGSSEGGRRAGHLDWLQQSVDALPFLVDVPVDLMHFLGGEVSEHGKKHNPVQAAGKSSKGCLRCM